ncbi:hypothetical protein TRVL_04303 [Trypanosoma vivax]|nr:hypothetical protein TRVL_04303 [Trypanosoma vivax]
MSAVNDSEQSVVAQAPAVKRRGRGTFNQPLRAEQPPSTVTSHQGNSGTNNTSNVIAQAAAVLLPTEVTSSRAPEEDLAAEYGGRKRDIPMNVRENFGVCENEHEADTVRQLLFRGEKRRRYCLIVGNLQNPKRPITLKLFGHKGLKPFKLQNKLIRLVNISVGRPRPQKLSNVIPEQQGSVIGDKTVVDRPPSVDDDGDVCEGTAVDRMCEGAVGGDVAEDPFGTEEAYLQVELPPSDDEEVSVGIDREVRPQMEAPRESPLTEVVSEGAQTHLTSDYIADDAMLPLTVEIRDSTATNIGQPSSVANSPVLTATRFDTLHSYFFSEFRHLLQLEDVRTHQVSINLNLGAVYCCLAREGSYSTPLKYATFSEFVQRMNEESMQLYFLKDAPACVSRAVDRECGALQSEASLSLVKIYFFSNERQSRTVARAMWDAHENRFVLLEMENSGVTFTWTVFSVDESGVPTQTSGQGSSGLREDDSCGKGAEGGAMGAPNTVGTSNVSGGTSTQHGASTGVPVRKKTVAFPFELELRAYRRWRQHKDHPVAPIAEAILDKLSLAEHNLIQFGSTIGYENMDLSKVCEADFESEDFNVESIIVEHTSRVKPRGTDLTVDSTSSLWIENFAAARAFRERQASGYENSSMKTTNRRAVGASRHPGGKSRGHLPQDSNKPSTPASRLTFFRSRGSTIHWKLRPGQSPEENLAPLSEALHFVQQVLNTANEIEGKSARGGEAPTAL